MPHDRNALEVKPGDRVVVECVVKAVHLTEDYCNVDLVTAEPMPPHGGETSLTMNARQVRIVQPRHDADYTNRLAEIQRMSPCARFMWSGKTVNGLHECETCGRPEGQHGI